MTTILSGAQKRTNLQAFVSRWDGYDGSERAEAQTFLNELFTAYGTNRKDAGVRFEDPQPRGDTTGFVDAIWDGVVIIEMKKPTEAHRLDTHREQALNYWRNSADPINQHPASRYVVLCAFSTMSRSSLNFGERPPSTCAS